LGKYLATLIYVGGQMVIVLLLALITTNLAHGEPGRILWYRPSVALGAPGAGILGAGLVAGLGILISLRAPTARQAQQTLLVPLTIILMLPSLGTMLLPDEQKAQLFRWFVQADVVSVLLGVLGVVALVDAALLAWAMSRFQRAKLILD
jgi:ABC-2 type transport system permease protein